jgi:putative protein-disulfide isomerase
MKAPILWYFADPMCSWCWGFAPAIDGLRDSHRDRLRIALVLGGLRHDRTPMTPTQRDDILHHWREVHARTGQPFHFDGALPAGFVYDTEPACRAVATAGGIDPALTFPLFRAIQSAFYADGRDVTRAAVLTELAAGLGVDATAFAAAFAGDEARARVQAHFRQTRLAGVRGFPTLILQQGERLTPVARGCEPLATVHAAIDAALAA